MGAPTGQEAAEHRSLSVQNSWDKKDAITQRDSGVLAQVQHGVGAVHGPQQLVVQSTILQSQTRKQISGE
tara:strand:+ start:342 stop:551 length:210 start_codon:yes stop_codon:yes gene_type:complete